MKETKDPVLSVVIPMYNEQDNIDWFYEELVGVLSSTGKSFELVYVNDGSSDKTDEKLQSLAKNDTQVQYICLSRNFKKEAATSAGINHARGQAVIILDGDGQHPSEKIPEMVKLWEGGAQQVVGIRTSNEKAGIIKTIGSKGFYFLSRLLGSQAVVTNATDFRLIDREIVDTLNSFTEKKRMTRSLLDWSGYVTAYMPFAARERSHGTASYNISALIRLALNGYIGSTLKPLYFVGLFGLVITGIASLVLLVTIVNDVFFNDALHLGVSGTAYIALLIMLLVGVLLICQGIIAAYIANIQLEAQNRPLYIVNKARSRFHR